MYCSKFNFDKDLTLKIKGIAIIMMFCVHFFIHHFKWLMTIK